MNNYFDSEAFRSLSHMAEEYDRIVSPLTEQLKLYDRWHEITSPLQRMVTLNHDVIFRVTAFDQSLARHLSNMIDHTSLCSKT